ncbi:hypothetical protein [Roseovarius nanhaiticus]|uniref:Flp pilus assembly protein, pilin Flp n=1 Tax=Roseovarius nanhaiticus TaxID=573024 RepID=A0A1N7FIQ2_9RHOB|nr:hypothetical protein [Roseovarius nanhaiticus]SEK53605.1 hypothetical protein SAMN05216208_1057 [Roseovarius nanhaiticus]SIS00229.1 hypothetical protein SAMN05421666_1079 [Roseovarius nanhaiticus]
MLNFIQSWLDDESGAITVDWVVLTAAIVGLGVIAVAAARDGVDSLTADIDTGVTATKVAGVEAE